VGQGGLSTRARGTCAVEISRLERSQGVSRRSLQMMAGGDKGRRAGPGSARGGHRQYTYWVPCGYVFIL
jgi:hypothetical protein